jgi:hypothetical protein
MITDDEIERVARAMCVEMGEDPGGSCRRGSLWRYYRTPALNAIVAARAVHRAGISLGPVAASYRDREPQAMRMPGGDSNTDGGTL